MNRQIFQQTGGFPLTTNTLNFAQASWLLMQNFGHIAGDLTILHGCEVAGTQVNDGAVFINGEILPFEGGTKGTNVIIQETKSQKVFEDGIGKDVEVVRVAKFGNGMTVYPWADFERITPIKILQKALIPIGMIAMWYGAISNIPDGWYLCNGDNGTPNLSNKFIRATNAIGSDLATTGGSDERTLQNINMPPHNHSGTTSTSGNHSHTFQLRQDGYGSGNGPNLNKDNEHSDEGFNTFTTAAAGNHNHVIPSDGGLDGVAQPFDNRPAYYTLAFIMFKGE